MRRLIALVLSCIPILQAIIYRQRLPELVASSFDGAGHANGLLERDTHLLIMITVGLGAFSIQVLVGWLVRHLDPSLINLPNRRYWLAPGRREATVDRLESRMFVFHIGLMAFLSYVNYLVLEANLMPEPILSSSFLPALLGFLLFTIGWVAWLLVSFRRPREASERNSLDPK